MPKQLLFDQAAREALRKGVQKVANAVRPTLGPRGRTVVIDKSWGAPTVTKDGVSVCEEVELTDPYENMAAKMIKEAASKTSDQAGDGTTTSAVLAEAIFIEGLRIVTAGGNPIALSRGIKRAAEAVCEQLKKTAEPLDVKDKGLLQQIGTLAAGNDSAVGEMLATAFQKVGKEGAISVEEGKGIQTEIKIVEGMQFDRGFLSPHFVTNPASVECVLENPFIFLFEEKLSPASQIVPLLEKIAAEKRPLLVIAEDVEGEALATLVGEQAARRLPGVRGEGARLRRPPEGDARGHRHPDRRPPGLQGPGHRAPEGRHLHPGPRQEGHRRRRLLHDPRAAPATRRRSKAAARRSARSWRPASRITTARS
jgi:chaperonin GroEL